MKHEIVYYPLEISSKDFNSFEEYEKWQGDSRIIYRWVQMTFSGERYLYCNIEIWQKSIVEIKVGDTLLLKELIEPIEKIYINYDNENIHSELYDGWLGLVKEDVRGEYAHSIAWKIFYYFCFKHPKRSLILSKYFGPLMENIRRMACLFDPEEKEK